MGTPNFRFAITVFLLRFWSLWTGVTCSTNSNDVNILKVLISEWGNTVPSSWRGLDVDPCGFLWVGVNCIDFRITLLALSSMGLKGNLPNDIGFLTELQTLDLSYNEELTGSLPYTLGNLNNLKNLIVIGCNFSGRIPDELGNLVNLEYLALNSNNFSGSIPVSLGNLVTLTWLDLGDNQLTGTLPVSNGIHPGLDRLLAAQHLHFSQNKLTGPIPHNLFSSSMNVTHILFDSNDFNGEIPSTLGLVKSLEALRLDRNFLNGSIPSTISNLQFLNELHLSNNKLEDSIPDLSGLTHLQYLDLSNNSFKSAQFPDWLTTLQNFTTVMLENCNMTGEIPSQLFNLPYLESVKLTNNDLNGTMVLSSSVSQNLRLIDLQNNSITNAQTGDSDITILLLGNPYCESQASNANRFCQIYSVQTYKTSLAQCGQKTYCSGKLKFNPRTCQCQQPFQGKLWFKTPSFSDLNDTRRFQSLEQSLQLALSVDAVYLCCLSFNNIDYLNMSVQFFPKINEYFGLPEIVRISFLLSGQIYQPPQEFGPYIFIADPYPFDSSPPPPRRRKSPPPPGRRKPPPEAEVDHVDKRPPKVPLRDVLPPSSGLGLIGLSVTAYTAWKKKWCKWCNRMDAPTSSPTSVVPIAPTLETPISGPVEIK